MVIKFLKKNINIITLIVFLLGFFAVKSLWIIGALLMVFVVLPIILCLVILDAIINPNSSVLNLISLLIVAFIFEKMLLGQDVLIIYSVCLIVLLGVLMLFNYLKKKELLKYSTVIVMGLTIAFQIAIHNPGPNNFNSNIFNKVGYQGKVCIGSNNCKDYTIPREYTELKFVISGDFCPVLRGVKNNNIIFINHLNNNIFPNAQDVEYVGNGYSNGNIFFKVKENDKYGFYMYDASMCYKYESFGETKQKKENLNYNPLTTIVPPIYDDIEIAKEDWGRPNVEFPDMYQAPNNDGRIVAIIGRNNNLYDVYIETEKSKGNHHKKSHDELEYKLFLKNKRSIKFIGKNKESRYPNEYLFEVDGKTIPATFKKILEFGNYQCNFNGRICDYKIYEGGASYKIGCPDHSKLFDYVKLGYCKFSPSDVQKYECNNYLGNATIYIENGRITSASGNWSNGTKVENLYNAGNCKFVPMKHNY